MRSWIFYFLLLLSPIAWARGGGGCFGPQTPIELSDGSTRPISQIQPGQKIMAFDAQGRRVVSCVERVFVHKVDAFIRLKTARGELQVTPEHPFYTGGGVFKTLDLLQTGDRVFAQNGTGLESLPILSMERCPQTATVYNLQTAEPNTYFAAGIAVHNKGGGFGGGGFHGSPSWGHSSWHSRSSSTQPSTRPWHERLWDWVDEMVPFLFFGLILVVWMWFRWREEVGESRELDHCFTPQATRAKVEQTRRLLENLARLEPALSAEALIQTASETFLELQRCWSDGDYQPMATRLMPDLYRTHLRQLESLQRNGEKNILGDLKLQRAEIIHLHLPLKRAEWAVCVLISAEVRDYYIDAQSGRFLRGDRQPARFQEFWTFHFYQESWRLGEIEQTLESDRLSAENLVETFTDDQLTELRGSSQEATGPAGPKNLPQASHKADRIQRMLRFLGQIDPLWQETALVRRVREVFTTVTLLWEEPNPEALPETMMFPPIAEELRAELQRWQQLQRHREYRNLCIRKIMLVLIDNAASNDEKEFTVRISAHAQVILKEKGVTLRRQEDVEAFSAYWVFGRRHGSWQLKEILSDMQGRSRLNHENIDAESSPGQVQWYYRQKHAI